jgi:hypothetical protein
MAHNLRYNGVLRWLMDERGNLRIKNEPSHCTAISNAADGDAIDDGRGAYLLPTQRSISSIVRHLTRFMLQGKAGGITHPDRHPKSHILDYGGYRFNSRFHERQNARWSIRRLGGDPRRIRRLSYGYRGGRHLPRWRSSRSSSFGACRTSWGFAATYLTHK